MAVRVLWRVQRLVWGGRRGADAVGIGPGVGASPSTGHLDYGLYVLARGVGRRGSGWRKAGSPGVGGV